MTTFESSSGSYRIEALKGAENYLSWRTQISDILTDLGLWEYTSGQKPRPEGQAANPIEVGLWDKNDRKALTVIRLRVNTEMLTYVFSSATSMDAWHSLANVFSVRGPLAQVLARRKFMRYQIDEGSDMEEDIRKLRGLREQLILLGQDISELEFSLILLTALPESYDSFISSIAEIPHAGELCGRLLQEGIRRKDRVATSTALAALKAPAPVPSSSGFSPNRSRFLQGVYCHNCGKEGHVRPWCKAPKDPNARPYQPRPSYQANSYQPRPPYQATSSVAHMAETFSNSSDGYAFVAEENFAFVTQDEGWLGDSASQSHIVRDKLLFSEYVNTPGNTIKGAGTCSALGRGNVRINFLTEGKRIARAFHLY